MKVIMDKTVLQDPYMQKILSDEENLRLFENFQENPFDENARLLDEKFRMTRMKDRAIAYFYKSIRLKAIEFDKKIRKENERCVTMLDKVVKLDDEEDTTMKDMIESSLNIEELLMTDEIESALKSLTTRQQKIIFWTIFSGYTEREVANHLGCSQQAVSKSKKQALKKLRGELDGEYS